MQCIGWTLAYSTLLDKYYKQYSKNSAAEQPPRSEASAESEFGSISYKKIIILDMGTVNVKI